MYALKNKVQLIGYVGNDPEIRTVKDKKVAHFRVATNDSYKTAEGVQVNETQWHNLVAWGKIAEIAGQYVVKGSEVAIEGKLTYRSYTDKDGTKKYFTEVVVNDLLLLGRKAEVKKEEQV